MVFGCFFWPAACKASEGTREDVSYNCRYCGNVLGEGDRYWYCGECGIRIWKTVWGREIDEAVLKELLENGRTRVLGGFQGKSGKKFSAALVLTRRGVELVFPEKVEEEHQKGKGSQEKVARGRSRVTAVRVCSPSPGTVLVEISEPPYKAAVNFGLVSRRMAECLGAIAAVEYIAHKAQLRDVFLEITANDYLFASYLLREKKPRDREMRLAVAYLHQALSGFAGWRARHEPARRTRLAGQPTSDQFPHGIFPWLEMEITKSDNRLLVRLPESPAVRQQFAASVRTAVLQGDYFAVPFSAEPVLRAWYRTVRGREARG